MPAADAPSLDRPEGTPLTAPPTPPVALLRLARARLEALREQERLLGLALEASSAPLHSPDPRQAPGGEAPGDRSKDPQA